MMDFISRNIANIVISALLLVFVVRIVVGLVRKKKNGKYATCGCSCDGCPGAVFCHDREADKSKQVNI